MTIEEQKTEYRTKLTDFGVILETREMTDLEASALAECKAGYEALGKRISMLEDVKAMAECDEEKEDDEDETEESSRSSQAPRSKRALPACTRDYKTYTEFANRREYRAVRGMADLASGKRVTGLEKEISDECARLSGRGTNGMFVPFKLEDLDKETRQMKGRFERRDLTTTTGSGAVETEWDENYWIEYLYNILLAPKLGIQVMSNVTHNYQIPRQNATASVQVVAEGTSATGSNETLDYILFQPRSAIGNVNVSRNFLLTASFAAENFVRKDLVMQTAVSVDGQIFAGTGAGATDFGILYDPSIPGGNVFSLAGSSYLPTWSTLMGMEAAVKSANVIVNDSACYVSSPLGEQVLAQTAKQGVNQTATVQIMLLEQDKVNAHKFFQSNQIPSNLVVSGQSGPFSALIFGVWDQSILAQYGEGLEILVDPYTNAAAGAVRIISVLSYDHKVRHGGAFAYTTSMLVA